MIRKYETTMNILLPLLLAAVAVNCGDEHDDHEADPAVDGCEHMIEGPSETVVASGTAEGAPSVSAPHRRYDIALTNGAGFVSFEADEEAEFYFFLNGAIDLAMSDADDQPIVAEEELTSVDDCSEVAAGAVYDLEAGTYTLHFTGGGNEIQLVPFEATEHDHDH